MIFDKNGNIKTKEMENILKTYYQSTGINISVINKNGKTLLYEGAPNTFCCIYN